ncbi:hypothetical protein [Lewinella sp. W8]|uniref:hypothetical protein n=1 Tax=Lewinella sp. W8 TaxID=2528208 RepID=UPI00106768FF|nr:hypothetical protein [Lewinella sp. W8]MTB50229.1 hypothetical protein [Lewinella sp. W8]
MRLPSLILLATLLLSCGGQDFDASSIPPDQLEVELSFLRMKDHGALEPVLEPLQLIDGWQFYVAGYQKTSALGREPSAVYTLTDRAGITYLLDELQHPEIAQKLEIGTYGFGRGRIEEVKRDLVKGEITGRLRLSGWQPRKE